MIPTAPRGLWHGCCTRLEDIVEYIVHCLCPVHDIRVYRHILKQPSLKVNTRDTVIFISLSDTISRVCVLYIVHISTLSCFWSSPSISQGPIPKTSPSICPYKPVHCVTPNRQCRRSTKQAYGFRYYLVQRVKPFLRWTPSASYVFFTP